MRYLHRSGIERCGDFVELRRLQRGEPSQWEVRHIGDALCGESIDESVVCALGYIVEFLDADDLSHGLRLG